MDIQPLSLYVGDKLRLSGFNVLICCIFLVTGTDSVADISDTVHDFSNRYWNPSGEICIVCHTPHNASEPQVIPLWNHETTVTSYPLYSSPTLDANVGQPSGTSRACLSCHDGTVAYDSFGGRQGQYYLRSHNSLGTDLSDDHPVSFTYDSALAAADGSLRDPAVAPSGLGGTIKEDLLINDQLQCSSCHDVHSASYVIPWLLIKLNRGSALCLTCHDK